MIKIDPMAFLADRFGPSARFSWMPNGGNLGDNLIAAGTLCAFDRAGLDWRFMQGGRETLEPHDVLVYGGGGSLVDLYQGAIECLQFLCSLGQPVVVLPQTVRGHDEFWRSAPPMIVFCRDLNSFAHMAQFPQIEALLADDMALSLDLATPPYAPIVAYRQRLMAAGWGAAVLTMFREDVEAGPMAEVGSSIDLSDLAYPAMRSRGEIESMAVFFLMAVAHTHRLRTNRLHVAVAGGHLGIVTEMHDNVYGKNRDVYEFSLRERFPSITFKAAEAPSAAAA